MASVLGNWLGNAMLDKFFLERKAYLALHVSDPGVLGSASSELSGGEYIRQLFPTSLPSNKTITNTAAMVFDNLPLTTIYYIGLWAAVTGGDFLLGAELEQPIVVPSSARLALPAQTIAVTL